MQEEISDTQGVPENPADLTKIENFEGIGELTVGVGNTLYILVTAICMFDDPKINYFLLAQKLKLSDRLTKTKIFPREGMALPDGEIYHETKEMEKA